MDRRKRSLQTRAVLGCLAAASLIALVLVPVAYSGDRLALLVALILLALGAALTSWWCTGYLYRAGETDGVIAGRAEQGAEDRRALHDGPLQTLEAIALEPPFAPDPIGELDRVRSAARAEAMRLRIDLGAGPARPSTAEPARIAATRTALASELVSLAAEFASDGLFVELTVAETAPEPSAQVRQALCAAVREALTNVVKHARTSAALVRLEGEQQLVRVIVRDHGCGMAPGTRPGFGQRESLVARLDAVGGRTEIWSEPGRGTRVTMEVRSS